MGSRDTCEDSVDIFFVIQQSRDAGTDLGHDFVVNTGRSLIHDEECDEILPHFAGDRAEDRLTSRRRIKKTVGPLRS